MQEKFTMENALMTDLWQNDITHVLKPLPMPGNTRPQGTGLPQHAKPQLKRSLRTLKAWVEPERMEKSTSHS